MKKYLLGIAAVLLAVCFSAFTSEKKADKPSTVTSFAYWYDTKDAGTKINHKVTSLAGMSKEQVLEENICLDGDVIPVCFIGTNDGDLEEDDVFPALNENNNVRYSEQ